MSTPEFEIVEAKANVPAEVDIDAVSAQLRTEHQQSTVNASVEVHGDSVQQG